MTRRWKKKRSDRPQRRLTARPTACASGGRGPDFGSLRDSGVSKTPEVFSAHRRPLAAGPARSRDNRFGRWWQDRFDLSPLIEFASKKTVPVHRLSWIYLLGGVALFLFATQIVTGCLLMLYYQPGEATSFESVQRIMNDVPFGWFVRSAHSWGAHLFVATVLLHLVTVMLTKAYRRPRELTWLTGVILLLLTFGLGFSGYLLPWNELSYYATLVGTQIAGSVPLVGDLNVRFLRGGQQVTGDTITRFYAAHVVIVPLIFSVILAVHLSLVQLQGMSRPLGKLVKRVKGNEPFFSEFLPKDATVWLFVLGAIATLAVFVPAETGIKADTLRSAPEGIKPEWYFLSVFQLLKYVPESVGVSIMAAGGVFLFIVPWLDRRAAREQSSPGWTCVYLALLAAAGVLHVKAMLSPSVRHPDETLTAESYDPVRNAVWLACFWFVIALMVYYLLQLRRHNRQLRRMAEETHD